MTGTLRKFQTGLLKWYAQHRRNLPWRTAKGASPGRPNPYHVLVSETMLQQTQVATVVPYFDRFVKTLPNFRALADADEEKVLRLWQGLGYYTRARNLHAAARQIMTRHRGKLPQSVDELLALPGVGRYTAGAISSLAFEQPAPILDGNVARVLCRIDRIESDPRQSSTRQALWRRAEQILPDRNVGDFNSALMELGATVCTPRTPDCQACPVRDQCEARRAGLQLTIPPPCAAKPRPRVRRWTFCIHHPRHRTFLIERRPLSGRWAGLWQFVTIDAQDEPPRAKALGKYLGLNVSTLSRLGRIEHALTHRYYEFEIFTCDACDDDAEAAGQTPRVWTTLGRLDRYPLPRPHMKIAQLLGCSAV